MIVGRGEQSGRPSHPLEARTACFTWIATQDHLHKRDLTTCTKGVLCEEANEKENHLLLNCTFTRQLWAMFLTIFGANGPVA